MKFTKITLSLALLGALTLGMAEDTVTADTTTTVDTQIEAIQTAPAQERVRLMNEFKQRLMQMNEEDRMAAIQEMQTKMQTRAKTGQEFGQTTATMAKDMAAGEGKEFGERTRTRAQEHAQEMQMQTNEKAVRTQTMTQQRGGNQLMHTSGGTNQNLNINMMRGR